MLGSAARTVPSPDASRAGWVYVLSHPAWGSSATGNRPGVSCMVKIGMTSRDPRMRAAEIASVSGLVAPCTVAWCVAVSDRAAVELAVKRALGHRRVTKRRELFRCTPEEARAAIEDASQDVLLGRVDVRRLARDGRRERGVWRPGRRWRAWPRPWPRRRHGVPAWALLLAVVALVVWLRASGYGG